MPLHDAVSSVSTPDKQMTSLSHRYGGHGNGNTMLLTFLCGAATGIAVGLLMAPMRGAAMRSTLRDYATHGGERLQSILSGSSHWAQDALHQVTAAIDEGRRVFRTNRGAASEPSRPLTASVGEISGIDRFEEPLGG